MWSYKRVGFQALLFTFPCSELLLAQSPHVQGNPIGFAWILDLEKCHEGTRMRLELVAPDYFP